MTFKYVQHFSGYKHFSETTPIDRQTHTHTYICTPGNTPQTGTNILPHSPSLSPGGLRSIRGTFVTGNGIFDTLCGERTEEKGKREREREGGRKKCLEGKQGQLERGTQNMKSISGQNCLCHLRQGQIYSLATRRKRVGDRVYSEQLRPSWQRIYIDLWINSIQGRLASCCPLQLLRRGASDRRYPRYSFACQLTDRYVPTQCRGQEWNSRGQSK